MKKNIFIIVLFITTTLSGQEIKENKLIVEFVSTPKILYRGIANRLRLNMPHADSIMVFDIHKNFIPKSDTGIYKVDCTRERSRSKIIFVDSYQNGVLVKSDSVTFKIKDLPRPKLRINENSGHDLKMSKGELKNATLEVYIGDFLFNAKIEVYSFYIKIAQKKEIRVEGNSINSKIFSKIKKLKVGDEILLFDISYAFENEKGNICHKRVAPMRIEIMDNQ